jgi:alpha-beta hydrolase superfamily lysophospholipase
VKTSTFKIIVPDGPRIHGYRWLPPGEPMAVVQIIHGMSEHAARYARFAEAMTDTGIAVYAADLPGHGKTAREGELGHIADRRGWRVALDAVAAVHAEIEDEQLGKPPNKPIFMLGHSMGSFLLQHYLVEHGAKLSGAILSATTGDMGLLRVVGLALLRIEALILGTRHRSKLGEQLSFRDFNKKFKPARTGFDWLSRDPAACGLSCCRPAHGCPISPDFATSLRSCRCS